jgi:hypothetical protein
MSSTVHLDRFLRVNLLNEGIDNEDTRGEETHRNVVFGIRHVVRVGIALFGKESRRVVLNLSVDTLSLGLRVRKVRLVHVVWHV